MSRDFMSKLLLVYHRLETGEDIVGNIENRGADA